MKNQLIYIGLCLSICLFNSCVQNASKTSSRDRILQEACAWLWDQQQADGAWHSTTHGILKGGESYTAFILWHLLEVEEEVFSKPALKKGKALHFLRDHLSPEGVLGLSDPEIVDYPNYATTYALRIFAKYGNATDQVLIEKMTAYLLSQQFTEQRGIAPDHLAYGAWGFGETNLAKGSTGHVDLSHTRRILETLRRIKVPDRTIFQKAQSFLHRLQKQAITTSHSIPYDGGFYASTVTTSTNKAALDTLDYYPSYATATADGLLALRASGYTAKDEPVQMAHQWLCTHPDLNRPEGIPTDDIYEWHKVMFFYHLASRAEALKTMEDPGFWKNQMVKLFAQKQNAEGYFLNPNGSLNKEDDPLLATTLAVIALTSCN